MIPSLCSSLGMQDFISGFLSTIRSLQFIQFFRFSINYSDLWFLNLRIHQNIAIIVSMILITCFLVNQYIPMYKVQKLSSALQFIYFLNIDFLSRCICAQIWVSFPPSILIVIQGWLPNLKFIFEKFYFYANDFILLSCVGPL